MPKETLKIEDFSGGLNTDAEHRDIPDNASPDAVNVSFDQKGVLAPEGHWHDESSALGVTDEAWLAVAQAGHNAFSFSSDYTNANTASTAPAYGTTGYYTVSSGASGRTSIGTFSTSGAAAQDETEISGLVTAAGIHNFYWVDEGLRVANSAFGTAASNKIRKLCYNDGIPFSAQDNSELTPVALKLWWDGDQEIKAPTAGTAYENENAGAHDTVACSTNEVDLSMLQTTDGGAWEDGTYNVGYSWVYDNKQESPIFTYSQTLTTNINDKVEFKVSALSTADGNAFPSVATADYRRTGARVYIWKDGDSDRSLVLDADWIRGVRANTTDPADASTWAAVIGTGNITVQSSGITHESFPSTETYYSSNFHGDQEVNYARYKTAVVSNRRTWIGNVFQDGRHHGDRVMYSPIDQYDKFPELNYVTALDSDGDEIVKLEAVEDRLLVFKQKSLVVLNITNPDNVMVEGTYKGLGIFMTGQSCPVETGVAWISSNGVYLFDGKNIQSLTDNKISRFWMPSNAATSKGKITLADNCISNSRATQAWDGFLDSSNAFKYAIIGYDSQMKKLLILRDSASATTDVASTDVSTDTLIYNFKTKTWAFMRPSSYTAGAGLLNDFLRTNMIEVPLVSATTTSTYRKVIFFNMTLSLNN